MSRRSNLALLIVGVPALLAAACQLVNGIGDELTYVPGDAGSSPDVTQTEPDSGSKADATTLGADAGDATVAIADAAADVARDAALDAGGGCPVDSGAPMVRIDTLGGWSYCIDVTEVTLGQFSVYAASHTAVGSHVPAACKTDAALNQHPQPPSGAPNDDPVSGVNFCWAWDYCNWVNKRLCGNLGGGPVTSTASSEWYYACSNGAPPTTYPYGDEYDAGACVVDASGPSAVGTHPGCRGAAAPFNAIFDMSGNLAEMDQTASSLDGSEETPTVYARGGNFSLSGDQTSCAHADGFGMYLQSASDFGFRCCADVH